MNAPINAPKSQVKRILVVTHFFPTHGGGIEIVAGQLITHLLQADSDLKIEWFASNTDASPPQTRGFKARAMPTWNALEARLGVPCPLWSPFHLLHLWRAVGRCDVAHLHDFAYFGNVCAAIFCRLRSKKYVVTQHIGVVPFQRAWMRWTLEKLNRTIGKWMLNGAAEVVFVSDEVRRYFARILGEKTTHLVPNGVKSEMFSPLDENERHDLRARLCQELGWSDRASIALFVGRFVEKKGVPLILELVRKCSEIGWVLAGHGTLEPGSEARKQPNLRVLKGRRGAEIADLMRAADLLVLPSQGEGFPLVVQEALACGTPVLVEESLAKALPGVAPFLHVLPLGKADTTEIWHQKTVELLAKGSNFEERRSRAVFARDAWSWHTCARSYREIYERALASNRAK